MAHLAGEDDLYSREEVPKGVLKSQRDGESSDSERGDEGGDVDVEVLEDDEETQNSDGARREVDDERR